MKPFYLRNGRYWTLICQRATVRLLITGIVVLAVLIPLMFVDRLLPVLDAVDEYVWYGALPGGYVFYCWREVKRLKRLGYRVCFDCGYELGQLPDRGRCPECGGTYDIGAMRAEFED
ncbi:MAG TPA: hypothetical protein VD997_04955 [Phycisphaerales bacterium]|nr:hypothetical protein [Phycisphaerales bacterium]